MHFPRLLVPPAFVLAAFVLASAHASAQIPTTFGFQHAWPQSAGYQAGANLGPFTRGVAGDFNGDKLLDAIVLDGAQPVFVSAPATYGALQELPFTANDLELEPGRGPGGTDALLAVNASGLVRSFYRPAQGAFGAPVVLQAGGWAGARMLRRGDLDAQAGTDLVGLGADGRSVLVLVDGGSSYLARPGFLAPASVRDLVLVEWDGDAGREIALRMDASFRVCEIDGTLLFSSPLAAGPGALAPIAVAGRTRELLAAVVPDALHSGEQVLYVAEQAQVLGAWPLGAMNVVALCAADYDGDGDQDLFVSQQQTSDVLMLRNLWSAAGGPVFGSATEGPEANLSFHWIAPPAGGGLTPPAGSNHAWPVTGDFDGDGDLDLLFPAELSPGSGATQHLHMFYGDTVDQAALAPSIEEPQLELDATQAGSNWQLLIAIPAPPGLAGGALAGATHLDVQVWKQPSDGTTLASLSAQSVAHVRVALPGGTSSSTWPLGVRIDLPESAASFSSAYRVAARFVQAANGALQRAFPASSWAFSQDPDTRDLLLADGQPNLSTQELMTNVKHIGVTGTITARIDSGFLEKPSLDPFDPDDLPEELPPEEKSDENGEGG